MEEQVARYLDQICRRILSEMDDTTLYVQENDSKRVSKMYRRAAADVMGPLVEILEGVYKEYPLLRPPELSKLKEHP